MKPNSVAILLSAYNSAETIETCLRSLQTQTYMKWKAYVIDDCSTDATAAIIKDVCEGDDRFVILQNKTNQGLTKNLVTLMEMNDAEFIARIDADDYYFPEKLQKQVDFLNRNNGFIICATGYVRLKGKTVLNGVSYKQVDITDNFFSWNKIVHGSVLFRKLPGLNYRSYFKFSQDYDLWLRMTDHGRIGVIPENLYALGISKKSISSKHSKRQSKFSLIALTNCRKLRRFQEGARISIIFRRVLFMSLKTGNIKFFIKLIRVLRK